MNSNWISRSKGVKLTYMSIIVEGLGMLTFVNCCLVISRLAGGVTYEGRLICSFRLRISSAVGFVYH